MSWIILALIGALATSLTTILAKIGIKDVKSNFATAYRTLIVIFCCVIMCLISGSFSSFSLLTWDNWLFLFLSGLATGASWLCYYRAIKNGNVNEVAPIDKSSFVLTSILFIIFFFDSTTNNGDALTIIMLIISIILTLIGTLLMIDKKEEEKHNRQKWLIPAIASAIFASLVSLFVKIGLSNIPTDLGTLIRTIIVFIFASTIAFSKKEHHSYKDITTKSWLFLTLSGVFTGVAWLSEYYALNNAMSNPLAVNSISKFSILLTMLFSYLLLKEKFNRRSIIGLLLLTLGIVIVIVFSL